LRHFGRIHRFLSSRNAEGSQNRDYGDDRQQLDQSEACVALGTFYPHRYYAMRLETP
jgi:hypothetical protein